MARRRRGRGEGSFEQLPSGKWRANLPLPGKKKIHSPSYPQRQQAAAWLHEQLEARRQGTLLEPCKKTVGDWLREWLELIKPKVEPATYHFYKGRVERTLTPALGKIPLGKLTALDVEKGFAQLTEKGVSTCEQRKAAGTLRTALKRAVKYRLIAVNVASEVDKPKHRPHDKVCWSLDEARVFLEGSTREYFHPYFVLGLDSGMRLGEMLGLHWPEVYLAEGVIEVRHSLEEIDGQFRLKQPKTERGRRRIWLGQHTVTALTQHRERLRQAGKDVVRGVVFPSQKAERPWVMRAVLGNALRRAVRRLGLPRIRPYDLRHISATLMLQAGAGLKMVSQRLGHESVEITLRFYVHVLPSEQQAAGRLAERLFGVIPPLDQQTS